jgi:hypothetical protein
MWFQLSVDVVFTAWELVSRSRSVRGELGARDGRSNQLFTFVGSFRLNFFLACEASAH